MDNKLLKRIIALGGLSADSMIVYTGDEELLPDAAAFFRQVCYTGGQLSSGKENITVFVPGDGKTAPETADAVINFRSIQYFENKAGNFNMISYKLGQLLKPGCMMISVIPMQEAEAVRRSAAAAYKGAGLVEYAEEELDGYVLLTARRARDKGEKKQEVYGVWDSWAPNYNECHKEELKPENLDLWRSVLKRVVDAPTGMKTLDIGTGPGFLSIMASEIGFDSYGIDISEQMLSFAEKHASERNAPVHLVHGDGDVLPFADETFIAVMNSRVLWTCVEPLESIREWMRVAVPGGKIISFNRTSANPNRQSSMRDSMLPMAEAQMEEYMQLYEKAGLTNIKAEILDEALSLLEGPVWYVVTGEKRYQ